MTLLAIHSARHVDAYLCNDLTSDRDDSCDERGDDQQQYWFRRETFERTENLGNRLFEGHW